MRDVARVLNVPFSKADRLAKLIPMQPGKNVTLDDAIKEVPEFREAIESDDEYKELMRVAKGLEGITRNLGMHAGGVLIAPGRLRISVRSTTPMALPKIRSASSTRRTWRMSVS